MIDLQKNEEFFCKNLNNISSKTYITLKSFLILNFNCTKILHDTYTCNIFSSIENNFDRKYYWDWPILWEKMILVSSKIQFFRK